MSRALWFGVAVLMVGCAARLTPAGAQVREAGSLLGPTVRAECAFLGVVEADDKGARVAAATVGGLTGFAEGGARGARAGRQVSGSASKMLRHIRNEVAELGGDVFVIAGVDRFEVQAEAYRCAARERWEGVEWQEVKN